MRHDYRLPAEWPEMSQDERDQWFHEERARRQMQRQATAMRKHVTNEQRRERRVKEARGYVDVEKHR